MLERRDSTPRPHCPVTPRRAAPRLSLTRAQDEICKAVEELDGGSFKQDTWTRAGGERQDQVGHPSPRPRPNPNPNFNQAAAASLA